MAEPNPQIRKEIDVVPTRQGEEQVFIMYDASGLSQAQLAISPVVLYIASQLNGENSLLDIQDKFATQSEGYQLPITDLEGILKSFDEALFLENSRFKHFCSVLKKEFESSPVRAATSAGSAYSDDPEKLKKELDAILQSAPPPEESAEDEPDSAPRGIIVPHIDYPRGCAGYGQAYNELKKRKCPDAIIVLGVAHEPIKNRIALCDKDFEIPGCTVANAKHLTRRIADECKSKADFLEDAFAHRKEHSVELQATWLRHIWGDKVKIVPVLVGSVQDRINKTKDEEDSSEDPQLSAFFASLKGIMDSDENVMLLASADLSHIGPGFGDDRQLTEAFLEETEEADRDYLASIAKGDAALGLQSLSGHGDRYHVCGAGCIYALGNALPGATGRLLGYHQAATPEIEKAVTFAAMIFDA